MTGTARASVSQPFGRVMRAIDKLSQHTAPTGAYRLALQVIFLRQMWESAGLSAAGTGSASQGLPREPHWAVLANGAADNAERDRPGIRTTEHALEDVWRQAGTARFLDLGPRDAVETPRLSGQADRLLTELIGAVAAADRIEGMFEACLDRYSRKLGRGGNYYTPRSISRLMAGVAAPRPGERVLDPVCGSAGLLVEAARFARSRAAGLGGLELHGRDVDAEVREVAAMNLALNSLDGDLATGAGRQSAGRSHRPWLRRGTGQPSIQHGRLGVRASSGTTAGGSTARRRRARRTSRGSSTSSASCLSGGGLWSFWRMARPRAFRWVSGRFVSAWWKRMSLLA